MSKLSRLERAVISMLLEGDGESLAVLREQAQQAEVRLREVTGVGFYCYFSVPRSVQRLPQSKSTHFGDVDAELDGLENGAGFVIFVKDGYLESLEGYTYGEDWPSELRGFTLRYRHDPRKVGALRHALGDI